MYGSSFSHPQSTVYINYGVTVSLLYTEYIARSTRYLKYAVTVSDYGVREYKSATSLSIADTVQIKGLGVITIEELVLTNRENCVRQLADSQQAMLRELCCMVGSNNNEEFQLTRCRGCIIVRDVSTKLIPQGFWNSFKNRNKTTTKYCFTILREIEIRISLTSKRNILSFRKYL